jgi:3,4-dihydroxy 2-butanone 4-phosphate synthase/GTP cyclohydrolase II
MTQTAPDKRRHFAAIEEAIDDIRQGKFVVVVDAADRENEGDLTIAAQFATPEAINFMATHARGLICLPLTEERCDELGLRQMAERNEAPLQTAFTVSIEAREGISTGISAQDRSRTIQVAIDPTKGPVDLVQPGHVFPLRAREGGVLRRAGQTEAAVDLARLAGLNPAGVVCEVMKEDGTMARVPDLVQFCERHDIKLITVADLIEYRRRTEKLVERTTSVHLPTAYGEFQAIAFNVLPDAGCSAQALPSELVRTAPDPDLSGANANANEINQLAAGWRQPGSDSPAALAIVCLAGSRRARLD